MIFELLEMEALDAPFFLLFVFSDRAIQLKGLTAFLADKLIAWRKL